eukprot:6305-Heterococcus_DN1.PRE.4
MTSMPVVDRRPRCTNTALNGTAINPITCKDTVHVRSMRSTPFTSVCTEHQQAQQADSAEAMKSTPTSCSRARMGLSNQLHTELREDQPVTGGCYSDAVRASMSYSALSKGAAFTVTSINKMLACY